MSELSKLTIVVGLTALAVSGCDRKPAESEADLLHSAVHQLTSVIVYDIFSPPQSSRVYAYASAAAYETLRHGYPEYQSLAGQVNGLTAVPAPDVPVDSLDLPLAGVHAFMTVGKAMTFSRARMDSLRLAMGERIKQHGDGISEPVFKRSIAYGEKVADHILAWAAKDQFPQSRGYPKFTVTSAPGTWVPTPPAYMDAIEPSWGKLRPFALDSASQFRAKPPPAFDTAQNSQFFREMKEVYDVVNKQDEQQREIAAFWDCNPYVMNVRGHAMYATKKITPGGHWMGIVRGASRKVDADIMKSSEAYVRTAMAVADGFIASWDEKYRSIYIRPETAINAYLDETWQPLLQTPPFPEYTSGHSVISNAAATVLTDQFGDGFAFSDSTEMEYGLPVRSFTSFNAAAAEAAISRLYAGIHYRAAVEEGTIQGKKVGAHLVQKVVTRRDEPKQNQTAAIGDAGASDDHSDH